MFIIFSQFRVLIEKSYKTREIFLDNKEAKEKSTLVYIQNPDLSTFSTFKQTDFVENFLLGINYDGGTEKRNEGKPMKITIPEENGFLPDKYGKYAPESNKKYDHTVCSFPITIEGVPSNAQSLALTFIDFDSTPVCGFTWIHWIMCGIAPDTMLIPENASQNPDAQWRQGYNSTFGDLADVNNDLTVAQAYIGPRPPDMDHTYTLRVYALDTQLDLAEGYFYNQLHWAIQGHIIDMAEVNVISRA